MLSLFVSFILLAPICMYIILQLRSLRRNIVSAKASGLSYAIVPFSFANPVSVISYAILRQVPESWKNWCWWLSFFTSLDFTRGWHTSERPFALMHTSTFLVISPSSTTLYTYDCAVTAHFLKSPVYGKPHELLGILNIFGPTMTGTDGAQTRLYRRTTAPFFNEQTMRRVWSKASMGAQAWMGMFGEGPGEKEKGNYWTDRMRAVVARLTLHVVASVCFEREKDSRVNAPLLRSVLRAEDAVPAERQLSFSKAMDGVLDWFAVIFVTPRAILRYSPLDMHREAGLAYRELGHYMHALKVDAESKTAIRDAEKESPTLLDLLVNADLESAEVLGNIFIFLFAGHEANANTLTFLFYLFACHPAAQLRAQDTISSFKDALVYDSAFPALIDGYVGACIHEALRLYTVLPFLVKTVPKHAPPGTADGRDFFAANGTRHRVPAGTMVLINTTALHTDPTHWPLPKPHPQPTSKPYMSATRTSPVDLFNPDLWLSGTKEKGSFLRPTPGAFVPFSDGSRGCLGKRFALVEMCAIVTQVLAEYSIELVAEDGAEWQRARNGAARTLLEGVEFHMSLRITGKVPVRFVKRGKEKGLGVR